MSYVDDEKLISVVKRVPVPPGSVMNKVKNLSQTRKKETILLFREIVNSLTNIPRTSESTKEMLFYWIKFIVLTLSWGFSSNLCHYCLFCDQIPVIMWDPDDPCTVSCAGCSRNRAWRCDACPQLLQPRWFLLQEEGVLRETYHWVGHSSLLSLVV